MLSGRDRGGTWGIHCLGDLTIESFNSTCTGPEDLSRGVVDQVLSGAVLPELKARVLETCPQTVDIVYVVAVVVGWWRSGPACVYDRVQQW